ncbi:MAG: serine protease [Candidatus Moranbacteria bacterium]|nr:serine protease [Candidatus Moranbacteria bacterium]
MKKAIRISLIILGLFCIGGAGSLFVNYVVFSKLVTHPTWSDNTIVKALSNKVVVTKQTEKVIVEDNESLSDISAQVSTGVVYVENVMSAENSLNKKSGSGIVISSDGIIAVHESVFKYEGIEGYKVGFFDGTVREAKKVFKDEFSGIIFLRVEDMDNLTAMPFANSFDAISGRKLINLYREQMSEQIFFTLGILSGYDYFFQSKQSNCDYLEGAFRVDFNENSLSRGLGGPMIDFNGEMVGLLAKNYNDEYFVITSNDVKASFDRFLENGDNTDDIEMSENEEDNVEKNEINERIKLGVSCNSLLKVENSELGGVKINYLINNDFENEDILYNLATELGINDGDIITQIDDYKVNPKNPLSRVLLNYKKGDVAKVKLLRDGKVVDLEINF